MMAGEERGQTGTGKTMLAGRRTTNNHHGQRRREGTTREGGLQRRRGAHGGGSSMTMMGKEQGWTGVEMRITMLAGRRMTNNHR